MTKYYKQFNENGEIVMLLTYDFVPNITNPLIVEITKEEYETLLAELIASLPEPEPSEIELKAQAYDIITGVGE
jgi:hypothetical protein